MEPLVYIILPVYNRIKITKKFIQCLKRQDYEKFILILVDDGCTDNTTEYVRDNIHNLIVLKGDGTLWWGGALHKAHSYLKNETINENDIVLTLNDDVWFDEFYLSNVVRDVKENSNHLIISPGQDIHSEYIERGFIVDWRNLIFSKMLHEGIPDALTTRGLYMSYRIYTKIGGFHPFLIPHYLSDLEYTMRARRKGYKWIVSGKTFLFVDRKQTGNHQDKSTSLREYFYDHLISKKAAYNVFYWGNFILLVAPWPYKLHCFLLNYYRFFKKTKAKIIYIYTQ